MAQSRSIGNLFVIGKNDEGQLGISNRNTTSTPININNRNKPIDVKEVHIGYDFTIIGTTDNQWFGCGHNGNGELGIGTREGQVRDLRPISYFEKNDISIKSIFTAPWARHVFWLSNSNDLYATGDNTSGQCCIGTIGGSITSPRLIKTNLNTSIIHVTLAQYKSYFLDSEGNVYTAGRHTGDGLQQIKIDTKIKSISSGESHLLLLSESGSVYGYGDNKYGQLGVGDYNDRCSGPVKIDYFDDKQIEQIVCGTDYSLAVDNQGMVHGFGHNEWGQLAVFRDDERLPGVIEMTKRNKISYVTQHWSIQSLVMKKVDFGCLVEINIIRLLCCLVKDQNRHHMK